MTRVLIAGAGIAGLALGIALRRHGIEVVALERGTRQDRPGGGLVLAPNGLKALRSISPELANLVRAAGQPAGARGASGHRTSFLKQDGRELGSVSFDGYEQRWGEPAVAILRPTLHSLLYDTATAEGVDVKSGFAVNRYVDLQSHVELTSASGDVVHGDVLVGADGLRSIVRTKLLNDGDPHYRGFCAIRGVGPVPKTHPDGFIAYGRGIVLFTAAIGRDQVYWVASAVAPADVWPRRPLQDAKAHILERIRDWDPALRQVVSATEPAECSVTDVYDRPSARTWSRGRVTLVGDAAHPMVYTMGQGAGMALEDAAVLGIQLGNRASSGVESALRQYTAERVRRVRMVVRQSRILGRIGHVQSPLAATARDLILSAVTRGGNADKQNATLFGWAPPDSLQ